MNFGFSQFINGKYKEVKKDFRTIEDRSMNLLLFLSTKYYAFKWDLI